MKKIIQKYFLHIIIVIVFILSFSHIFKPILDLNGDNFNYLLLSKAIAEGKGYVSTLSGTEVPTNFYPPGYPTILAFFRLFLGENIIAFKIINGIFLLTAILLLFAVGKSITTKKGVFFSISILLLLNYHIMRFSTMIMSEMTFILFYSLAIYSIYKLPVNNKFFKSPYFYLLITSISISFYTRTVGITIFGATLLHYLFLKQWKISGSIILSFILLYLPWQLRNASHGINSRYLGTVMTVNPWQPEKGNISTVSEFFEKMIANFNETVIKGFIDSLFPFLEINYNSETSALLLVSSLIILGIIFYGALKMGKLKYVFLFFILGNIGLFMLWHGGNGIRYVIPIIPIIFICFFNGLFEILNLILKNERVIVKSGYSILLLGFLSLSSFNNQAKINKQDYPANFQNYINIAKSVKLNTPQDVIICGRKPEILHYFSERPSFNYKYSSNTNEVIEDLENHNADYVILDQLGYGSTPMYLVPAINANPSRFKSVIHLENPDTYLLQFIKNK